MNCRRAAISTDPKTCATCSRRILLIAGWLFFLGPVLPDEFARQLFRFFQFFRRQVLAGRGQCIDGLPVLVLGPGAVPGIRVFVVPGHSPAAHVQFRQPVLGLLDALLRRLAEPLGGFLVALLHALALQVHHGDVILGETVLRSFGQGTHGVVGPFIVAPVIGEHAVDKIRERRPGPYTREKDNREKFFHKRNYTLSNFRGQN